MPQLLTRQREISLDSYARLRDQVRETLLHGQARIEWRAIQFYERFPILGRRRELPPLN